MKKKMIFSISVMVVGAILLAVGLLAPVAMMASAAQKAPFAIIGGAEDCVKDIGIIGSADDPTYMYLHSSANGGLWMALTALGTLALISGLITFIADITAKRKKK